MILQREHIPQANAGALDLEGKRDKGNTMEPPPGDTFIQRTSPFEGHKIWSQKNAVHIIFGHSFARKKEKHSQKAFISLSLHKLQCQQLSQPELSQLNLCTALVGILHTTSQRWVNHDFLKRFKS